MHRPHLSFLVALIAVTASFAQTGLQADKIPACVKECDPAAIASVNCANEDQHCHCFRQDGILANITACADRSCEDADRDIDVFTKLFDEVCQQFNITVPSTAQHGSSNGSNVTAEYWGGDGNYGGGSGGNGGYGGGGGGWSRGAANSLTEGSRLVWTFGGVACAIALVMMV